MLNDTEIEIKLKLKPMVVRNAKVKFFSKLVEAMAKASPDCDYLVILQQIAEGFRGETPEHIFGMLDQKLQEKIRNRVKRRL